MAPSSPPLAQDAAERSRRVIERLTSASGPDGFLPFDRFMEIALYSDTIGYYHTARSPLGTQGDFYTAAHVDPIFAQCVAARIRSVRAAVGATTEFRVVELGPGDGTLATGIARALASDPAGIEYVLVDRSRTRSHQAVERVQGAHRDVVVHSDESLGAIGPFAGVVLANELLDAQPARRLRWDGAAWREVGVRVVDGRVQWSETELRRAVPGAALPPDPASDLVFEVSPAAEGIVREIADHLAAGAAILMDYGMEEAELLGGHSGGTLAAVRDHRFVSDPLDAPGTSDLSTFVNFSRIRAAARAGGLAEVSFGGQAETLGVWGFPALLESALRDAPSPEARVRLQLAAKNLLFGFERFRVLELSPPSTAALLTAVK
jgi:SAM-dependent MidA family methyltransferase